MKTRGIFISLSFLNRSKFAAISPLVLVAVSACQNFGKGKSVDGSTTPVVGNIIKGPLNNALVFLDLDGDNVLDSNENNPIPLLLTTRIDLDVVQDPSAASSAGDPYVWPIKSNVPVKLPDTTAVYRMFEQGNTYINALVDCATAEHKQRMLKFFNKVAGGMNVTPIIDGFFYRHIFIHVDGHEMMVDLSKKTDSYSTAVSYTHLTLPTILRV